MAGYLKCPKCGADFAADRGDPLDQCGLLRNELSAYTLMKGDPGFLHQHVVDAYAAQHFKPEDPKIGILFSLMGLYLLAEKGYSGREVQLAHMDFAKERDRSAWPVIETHPSTWRATIQDVMMFEPGFDRDHAIKEWARNIWRSWDSGVQAIVTEFCRARGR